MPYHHIHDRTQHTESRLHRTVHYLVKTLPLLYQPQIGPDNETFIMATQPIYHEQYNRSAIQTRAHIVDRTIIYYAENFSVNLSLSPHRSPAVILNTEPTNCFESLIAAIFFSDPNCYFSPNPYTDYYSAHMSLYHACRMIATALRGPESIVSQFYIFSGYELMYRLFHTRKIRILPSNPGSIPANTERFCPLILDFNVRLLRGIFRRDNYFLITYEESVCREIKIYANYFIRRIRQTRDLTYAHLFVDCFYNCEFQDALSDCIYRFYNEILLQAEDGAAIRELFKIYQLTRDVKTVWRISNPERYLMRGFALASNLPNSIKKLDILLIWLKAIRDHYISSRKILPRELITLMVISMEKTYGAHPYRKPSSVQHLFHLLEFCPTLHKRFSTVFGVPESSKQDKPDCEEKAVVLQEEPEVEKKKQILPHKGKNVSTLPGDFPSRSKLRLWLQVAEQTTSSQDKNTLPYPQRETKIPKKTI